MDGETNGWSDVSEWKTTQVKNVGLKVRPANGSCQIEHCSVPLCVWGGGGDFTRLVLKEIYKNCRRDNAESGGGKKYKSKQKEKSFQEKCRNVEYKTF